MESVDRDATTEAFTKVLFPDLLTLKQMAYFRLLIAAIILGMSIHIMLGPGWTQETTYRKGSKLLRTPNMIRGIKTMCPFTSMSWNLLGASFTMSGIIALRVANEVAEGKDGSSAQISPWILRSALILWEMSAPFTLLVAAVIRYAIWPAVLHEKADTSNLKSFRNILMHNANVLFAMLETSLLGGVKVRFRHIAFAPIFGCMYVIFSWLMVFQWNTRDKGPQFIYFFFDTTLSDGKTATLALLMLLLVLIVFYAIFVSAEPHTSGHGKLHYRPRILCARCMQSIHAFQ